MNLKDAKTEKTLKPGDNGTKKMGAKYGWKLVKVRYRYDREKKLRYKTVELIEDFSAIKDKKNKK